MWKDLEEFVASSQDQHAVVGSITDRTTEKRCLDSGQLNIKVPHIFLRDCEWEIQTVSDGWLDLCAKITVFECYIVLDASITHHTWGQM